MGNQYSITVSDRTDQVLDKAKKAGYKVSQVIDAVVDLIGYEGCARVVSIKRMIAANAAKEEEQ